MKTYLTVVVVITVAAARAQQQYRQADRGIVTNMSEDTLARSSTSGAMSTVRRGEMTSAEEFMRKYHDEKARGRLDWWGNHRAIVAQEEAKDEEEEKDEDRNDDEHLNHGLALG